MAQKARRHIHKYYRVQLSFGRVMACALSDCTHYMPAHIEGLLNGKKSICWSCDEIFQLHPLNLTMTKPLCDECRLGMKESEIA